MKNHTRLWYDITYTFHNIQTMCLKNMLQYFINVTTFFSFVSFGFNELYVV